MPCIGGCEAESSGESCGFPPRSLSAFQTSGLRLQVLPNPAGHLLQVGILDNLGKGASGVAIQSLNLMLGLGETTGLPAPPA